MFGEIVCGSPGSGKSTYCYGKYQLFTALLRPIVIINLDPANHSLPYPCSLSISSLICLESVMEEHHLGPNGAMLFCMEYLEANFDWLEDHLDELSASEIDKDAWIMFDIPGQVELSTNHDSLKRVIQKLSKRGLRLTAVHLCDAHYITDASKYISVLLLSLRTMLHLELPHINVLSKIDLLKSYGELNFNLEFYTEVQDLEYLLPLLSSTSSGLPNKWARLNEAFVSLVEDYSLLQFQTLAIEDKTSIVALTHVIDRASGYVFVPPPTNIVSAPAGTVPPMKNTKAAQPNSYALFSSAIGPSRDLTAGDIQERWIDAKEEYDAFEKKQWRKEGEEARRRPAEATEKVKVAVSEKNR